jgi:RimJ/RimL family protein N-acetyltransferase
MKKGSLVYLTAIEESDLKQLKKWRNIESFKKHFREYREINDNMQIKWFQNSFSNDPTTLMFSIKRISDNELLGACGLCYINWIYRHADLSLYIGYNEVYIDEEGYAKESCELLFDYGFNQLGLNKIWTEIYEFDEKKKVLYKNLGFEIDGRLRENYFYDGKWWDSFIISLLRREYSK